MIWKPPRLWEGGSCFILGGGASVPTQFNVPFDLTRKVCERKLPPSSYVPYMKAISNSHIIGINNAYQLGGLIDILFFGDSRWHINHSKRLAAWPGVKVTCDGTLLNRPRERMEGMKCLDRDREHIYGISSDPTKVSWNGNSGSASISLAAHLGIKTIYLLGFDMCLFTGYSHWHPPDTQLNSGQRQKSSVVPMPYAKHLVGFSQIAKDAKQQKIEIFNVSTVSRIEEFPKVSLKTALDREGIVR